MSIHTERRIARLEDRVDKYERQIKALIESLNKICPACLAAVDQHTHDMLHLGKSCPTKNQEHPRNTVCVLCDKDPEECECP